MRNVQKFDEFSTRVIDYQSERTVYIHTMSFGNVRWRDNQLKMLSKHNQKHLKQKHSSIYLRTCTPKNYEIWACNVKVYKFLSNYQTQICPLSLGGCLKRTLKDTGVAISNGCDAQFSQNSPWTRDITILKHKS